MRIRAIAASLFDHVPIQWTLDVEASVLRVALTPEQLAEDITPFSPESPLTRKALLTLTLEHEIHHRGQLYTYLRIAGCEIPPLFSAETVQEFEVGR